MDVKNVKENAADLTPLRYRKPWLEKLIEMEFSGFAKVILAVGAGAAIVCIGYGIYKKIDSAESLDFSAGLDGFSFHGDFG